MNRNIPEDLDHLDELTPEQLGILVIEEVQNNPRDRTFLKALLAAGADINIQDTTGWASLHVAAFGTHIDIIQLLINSNADLDAPNGHGWTALHFAAVYRSPEVIRLLLNAGASKDAQSVDGKTPWDKAPDSTRSECPELNPCISL